MRVGRLIRQRNLPYDASELGAMFHHRYFATAILASTLGLLLTLPSVADDRQSKFRDITVEPSENLEDAVCIFCSIHVKGQTADAVTIMGGVEISGKVNGSTVVFGGGLKLNPGATAEGSIVVIGGRLETAPGATLKGEPTILPWIHIPGQRQVFWKGALGTVGFSLGFTLLSFAILLGSKRTEFVATTMVKRKLAVFMLGLVIVALTFTAIIFAEDFDDWEDAIIYAVLIILPLLCLKGLAPMNLLIGRFFSRAKYSAFVSMLLGAVVLALLLLIPFAGLVVLLLALSVSAGSLPFLPWRNNPTAHE